MPSRIKITIAYDGHPYQGWQIQPNGDSIQKRIQSALEQVSGSPISIQGSGRTDTGVHALAQVAHFDAPANSTMSADNWYAALNTKLPSSIRIVAAEEVSDKFHARFSATSKTYRYHIFNEKVLSPFLANRSWHIKQPLDFDLIQKNADLFLGEHTFQNFAALRGNETPETSYLRKIYKTEVGYQDNQLYIEFSGNGFLYKMVRFMVGSLIHQSLGRIPENSIKNWLTPESNTKQKPYSAPAVGLYLKEVCYDEAELS